jgi:hypothetical protein
MNNEKNQNNNDTKKVAKRCFTYRTVSRSYYTLFALNEEEAVSIANIKYPTWDEQGIEINTAYIGYSHWTNEHWMLEKERCRKLKRSEYVAYIKEASELWNKQQLAIKEVKNQIKPQ